MKTLSIKVLSLLLAINFISFSSVAQLSNDLSTVKILYSMIPDCGLDSVQVSAVIKNSGTKSQIKFDMNLEISEGTNNYSLTYFYQDSILASQTDTVYFNKFNTISGGTFNLKVFSSLSQDDNRKNDTLTTKIRINPFPGLPSAKNDTICENSLYGFTTAHPAKSVLRWYDAKTGGKLIAETEYLSGNKLKKDTSFYVSAVSSNLVTGSISTVTSANNGCGGGIMLDIIPKRDLQIDSFRSFFSTAGSQTVYIYIKKGSYSGFETNSGAWIKIDSATSIGINNSTLATIKPSKPILLDKDSSYAIYLNYYARYTTGTSTSTYSNNDMEIKTGTGLCSFFGGTNAYRIFSGQVFYRSGADCESERVAYKVKVNAAPVINLGKDTSYCANSGISYKLDPGAGFASYLWSTSDKSQSITVNNAGTYSVTVTDQNKCSGSDQIVISKIKNPVVNLGKDTSYCANSGIDFTLDAGSGYKTYKWNNTSANQSINVNSAGVYHVMVTDNTNCEAMDTIIVSELKNPVVNIGKDTFFCVDAGIDINLDAGSGFANYQWSNSTSKQSINVTSTGLFSVIVTGVNSCLGGDTIFIGAFSNPILDLGEDTFYCANTGLNKKLDAGAGYVYKWSTGESTQTINITGKGIYFAEIRDAKNCPAYDTVMVTEYANPVIDLGPDRILNPDLVINEIIFAPGGYAKYKWSNGSPSQSISVNTEGIYSVVVADKNTCEASDTINIRFWKTGNLNSLNTPNLRIFPNPTGGLITISIDHPERMVLYNATGALVQTYQPGDRNPVLNLSEFPAGIYFLWIENYGYYKLLKR